MKSNHQLYKLTLYKMPFVTPVTGFAAGGLQPPVLIVCCISLSAHFLYWKDFRTSFAAYKIQGVIFLPCNITPVLCSETTCIWAVWQLNVMWLNTPSV